VVEQSLTDTERSFCSYYTPDRGKCQVKNFFFKSARTTARRDSKGRVKRITLAIAAGYYSCRPEENLLTDCSLTGERQTFQSQKSPTAAGVDFNNPSTSQRTAL